MTFAGFLFDSLAIVIALFVCLIAYFKYSFTYWQRRNIPVLPNFVIPFGNAPNPLTRKETFGFIVRKFYQESRAKPESRKICGVYFFTTPSLLINDLDLVKHILTKDFANFTDRGVYYNERDDPLSAHLFALGGPKWRHLRTKLTPTFTSGKMRHMFQTLVDCEKSLSEALKKRSSAPIDIKDLLGCFTTDIIGNCAFGLECDSFNKPNSPFRVYGKKVFNPTRLRNFIIALTQNFQNLARFLRLNITAKDTTDFFMKVVEDTVGYRESNDVSRKDFLQLLIELKNSEESFTLDEVAAQCFIFFLAGFETSSTTMTFALYELAKDQELQQKVRDEINKVLGEHDGSITYDAINEMKFMQQVIDETLRKYPPVPFLTRLCVKDYKVPGEEAIIEKGTRVMIPVLGIHSDEEYYENPEKFDPDRFSEENIKTRHQYAHIPFGEGPRICIGLRFGIMQSKIGLTSLIRDYTFTINPKTQDPLKMSTTSFILAADGDIWLDLKKIQK